MSKEKGLELVRNEICIPYEDLPKWVELGTWTRDNEGDNEEFAVYYYPHKAFALITRSLYDSIYEANTSKLGRLLYE